MKNYYVNYTIFKRNEIEFVVVCYLNRFMMVNEVNIGYIMLLLQMAKLRFIAYQMIKSRADTENT